MFSKILIKGEIEIVTGMHIGTGGEYAAIGAADSPVVRDNITNLPIIPGSSLKGKLRSVIAMQYNPSRVNKAEEDCEEIKRLFGDKDRPSRIVFSDMLLSNAEELKGFNIHNPTEVKFENTINRLSGVANPRQIERVIRGCKFDMEIVYNMSDLEEAKSDIKMLATGFKLLQHDYLGGHGSRGYGKIKFNYLNIQDLVGEVDDVLLEELNSIIKEVN